MVRKNKDSGLLAIALSGQWQVAATISVVFLALAYIVLPLTLGGNRITAGLIGSFRTPLLIVATLMGVIAFIKYLLAKPQARVQTVPNSKSNPVSRLRSMVAEPDLISKPAEWSLGLLQSLEWKRFEDLCAAYYREKGIRCATTQLGPDGGIDIRLFQAEGERTTTIVQCKAWPGQKVGVKPIRELLGVKVAEQAEKAFFMTCGGYTDEAIAFAKANGITLFTGEMLLMTLQRLPTVSRQRLLVFATEGDYTTPSCPKCGQKLVARESERGKFWGCQSYPRCRGMLAMRGV